MTSLIAALALSVPMQAPTNSFIVVGLRTGANNYQTFVGSRLGVSSFLRKVPGQLWLADGDGWREVGLVRGLDKVESIFSGQDGKLDRLLRVHMYVTDTGPSSRTEALITAVTKNQISFQFEERGDLKGEHSDTLITYVWPNETHRLVPWETGLSESAREAVNTDLSRQIENTKGHLIRPDGFDVLDWARIHAEGRWQLLMRVSGLQRSASGVLNLMTDDHLTETERKDADRLMSAARSQHQDALDVYADEQAALAIILTPNEIFLHEYRQGNMGKMLKSARVPPSTIILTQASADSNAREVAQQAARLKPTEIPDSGSR